MRLPAVAMALGMLSALAFGAWATGCTDLSNDCELNLNCAPTKEPAGPSCDGAFFSPQCDGCLRAKCCETLCACKDDGTCMYSCAYGVLPSPPECTKEPTSARFKALEQCMKTTCNAECAPPDQCNPVTNAGCASDGSQCDLVYPGSFVCFPPFGTAGALCGKCDNLMGPFCGPGLRCHGLSNTCARFCCSDADCGTGRCELNQQLAFGASLWHPQDMVGVCVTQDGSTSACDALPMAPSSGACFGGYPPM